MSKRKDVRLFLVLLVLLGITRPNVCKLEKSKHGSDRVKKTNNPKHSKLKLVNVFEALEPDKNEKHNKSSNSNRGSAALLSSQQATEKRRAAKKNGILESVMTKLASGRNEIINLPGAVNVFGPPPKNAFSKEAQQPVHIVAMPHLRGSHAVNDLTVVPPHFNTDGVPVHLYTNSKSPEISGGHPQEVFVPFPSRFTPGFNHFRHHHSFDTPLQRFGNRIHRHFGANLQGPFVSNGDQLHDVGIEGPLPKLPLEGDDHLPFAQQSALESQLDKLHGLGESHPPIDLNPLRKLQLDPVLDPAVLPSPYTDRFHPVLDPGRFEGERIGEHLGERIGEHLGERLDEHLPIDAAQHATEPVSVPLMASVNQHENTEHFLPIQPKVIIDPPARHLYLPGKEMTVGSKEYNLNNLVHLFQSAHQEPAVQDSHATDAMPGAMPGGIPGAIPLMIAPPTIADGEYDANGALGNGAEVEGPPVEIADPEHIYHEHHTTRYHHHLGKNCFFNMFM